MTNVSLGEARGKLYRTLEQRLKDGHLGFSDGLLLIFRGHKVIGLSDTPEQDVAKINAALTAIEPGTSAYSRGNIKYLTEDFAKAAADRRRELDTASQIRSVLSTDSFVRRASQ